MYSCVHLHAPMMCVAYVVYDWHTCFMLSYFYCLGLKVGGVLIIL